MQVGDFLHANRISSAAKGSWCTACSGLIPRWRPEMRGLWICGWWLLSGASVVSAATVTIHECPGQDGERVFSDRPFCAADALRTLVLDVPISQPPPPEPTRSAPTARSRSSVTTRPRSSRTSAEAQSYLCESGDQRWYQHNPCGATLASTGKSRTKQQVRQSRVPRAQACREISRPAALLRRGSERDERAGPYARATGRDPCR